jgi:signal transduction histidine kinase
LNIKGKINFSSIDKYDIFALLYKYLFLFYNIRDMKKFGVAILLSFIFLVPLTSYATRNVKNIVIFFSLNGAIPGYQSFLEGFRSTIYEQNDEPYNLLIEYLDVERFPNDDHALQVVNLYNERFKQTKIDLVTTFAPGTYEILKNLGLEALKTSPVINVEFENFSLTKKPEIPDTNTFTIRMKLDVKKSLRAAFNLFPDRTNVFVLSGVAPADSYFMSVAREASKSFETTHKFTFFSGLPIDSVLKILQNIPVNSMVIIPSYMKDINNTPMSSSLFISAISNQNRVPVFTLSDNFIKRGGIGGFVFSFFKVGNEVREVSLEILDGKPLKDIKVNEDFYQQMYDWKQLKKWNLEKSSLIPSDSIFYNKEFNFISEYRWRLLFVLLFIILETILIVFLYRANRRQKEFVRQKAETEKLYRELIRDERLLRMAELTGSLSHELNQPLTAILYSAQAGKRFLDSGKLDQAQAKEIFDNIIEDDKRAGGIISGVRSLMKSETREKEIFILQDTIQDTINIYHTEALQQNIQIRYSQQDKPILVSGDRIQLQQVLLNLFSNAARAMQNTAAENKIIEIKQQVNHNSVAVSVRDNGTGISAEIIDKIFRPFTSNHKSGLGIGLSISRSIIERHGGTIKAENIEGGGAEFSFTLKVAENE